MEVSMSDALKVTRFTRSWWGQSNQQRAQLYLARNFCYRVPKVKQSFLPHSFLQLYWLHNNLEDRQFWAADHRTIHSFCSSKGACLSGFNGCSAIWDISVSWEIPVVEWEKEKVLSKWQQKKKSGKVNSSFFFLVHVCLSFCFIGACSVCLASLYFSITHRSAFPLGRTSRTPYSLYSYRDCWQHETIICSCWS